MKTIFPKPINVIRTRTKKLVIPPGFVELNVGEIITHNHLYREHNTRHDGSKEYYGNWVSPTNRPRISIGEAYRPENGFHYTTIKPISPVFDVDKYWAVQIKFYSSKEYNKFISKMNELGFDGEGEIQDNLVAVVNFIENRVSWNNHYTAADAFGFPIDYKTPIGKIHLKMLFEFIEKRNKENKQEEVTKKSEYLP